MRELFNIAIAEEFFYLYFVSTLDHVPGYAPGTLTVVRYFSVEYVV
jgi:hypothetical protein